MGEFPRNFIISRRRMLDCPLVVNFPLKTENLLPPDGREVFKGFGKINENL